MGRIARRVKTVLLRGRKIAGDEELSEVPVEGLRGNVARSSPRWLVFRRGESPEGTLQKFHGAGHVVNACDQVAFQYARGLRLRGEGLQAGVHRSQGDDKISLSGAAHDT